MEPKVILRHCDAYEAEQIRRIIREGLEELDLRPFGRTLIKPKLFEHAFTRPEFVECVALALRDRAAAVQGPPVEEIAVGGRCGTDVPTRVAFECAKYYPMFERADLDHYCFEEEPLVEIPLTHGGCPRDPGFAPEPIAKADFFVHCPKLESKHHVGADVQYLVQPRFIAMDGGLMDLIVMGNDQPAIDAVGSVIIHRASLEHMQIEIRGDVTLEEAKGRHRACSSAGSSPARIRSYATLPH